MRRSLDDLDLFARVARHRSFRRAATETGLSPSSVSERIRALEEALDLRLLTRTTRSVSPTEAGLALLQRLAPALGEIDAALGSAASTSGEPAGTLRINAPQAAAQLVLAPLLAPFIAAHPRITVEILVEDGLVDVLGSGFDAGIRYGESLARDMIAVPLGGPQRYALVAAPALLARTGVPRDPADLVGRPAIRHRFPSGVSVPWTFEKDGRSVVVRPDGPMIASDPHLEVAAAIGGAGFLITFEGWVKPAVEDGRLVQLLADWLPPFDGPFLYYASRRQMPPPLRAFLDFLAGTRRAGRSSEESV